jgi:uncharacterized protein with von Willebrand factor type A (vWA) domain
LGIADYLDAIRALNMQMSDPAVYEQPGRDVLQRLCRILWARGAEEARLIDSIFASIPPPTQDDIDTVTKLMTGLSLPRQGPRLSTRADRGDQPHGDVAKDEETRTQSIAVEIQTRGQADGVPLPQPVLPALRRDIYVMDPQTVVSARTLATLWRRYRRMMRSGPRTELDVDKTIDAICRAGMIEQPVLRAGRINRARLLILADVSPSMAPWRPFLEAVARSLPLSRLQDGRILYFANVPRRSLFRSPNLADAEPVERVLEQFAGAGLLILSDGGAARGYLSRQRVAETKAFVERANQHARAIVWLNPMPRPRWKATSAAAIASTPAASFLTLDVPALIRAVDILRGAKSH